WITKTDKQKDLLENVLSEFVLPKYNELVDFYDQGYLEYYSAIEVKRYFYTFGILSYINKYLQVYRDENDVMLISDLPDFLNKIISDSDTPYIYEKVGSRFDNYLIDEFQDTSAYQWNNFKPLVKNATDQGQFCMVVGDAKQSIYRFRGGDWKLLQHQVKHDIGEVLTIENNLDTNWRSSANVIGFNNDIFERLKPIIQGNYINNPSELIAAKMEEVLSSFNESFQKLPEHKAKDQGLVELKFIEVERGAEEGFKNLSIEYTIQKVEELQQAGYELRDIAILTRTTQEGKNIARAFIEHSTSDKAITGLRYDVVSKEALYLTTSHVVQFIISVIKWLHDEKNKIELAHWFCTYLKYLKKSVDDESELYFQLDNWAENVPADFVKLRHQLKSLPLYELVEELCRIFELSKVKEEYTYLQGFQDAVLEYSKNERGDISAFLVWWEDVRKNRSIIVSDENNAVKVLTIHKSKGLEFPVVIIPFLSWSLDKQNNAVDSIMWCETIDKPPFNLMPMVPLKYATALQNTYWADEYHHEKLKNLLDNLNVLYVAVTRPESALYMFAPKGKESGLNKVNDLVYQLVSGQEKWDAESQKYTLGTLPEPIKSGQKSNEVSLKDYSSHSWRSKVRLQMRDSANQSKEQFNEAAAHGIKLHDALSKIRYADQVDQFKEHPLFADLNKTVLALSEYFDKDWEVRTEVPVLLPNGDMRRIDRLNQKADKVVLIDYKTGSERDKDKSQMQEYMRLVSQMIKKPVEGLLFYLESQEILKVEGGQHEA
ncbi:3'-5' exonuclease, partial [Fulvivirga sp.]